MRDNIFATSLFWYFVYSIFCQCRELFILFVSLIIWSLYQNNFHILQHLLIILCQFHVQNNNKIFLDRCIQQENVILPNFFPFKCFPSKWLCESSFRALFSESKLFHWNISFLVAVKFRAFYVGIWSYNMLSIDGARELKYFKSSNVLFSQSKTNSIL